MPTKRRVRKVRPRRGMRFRRRYAARKRIIPRGLRQAVIPMSREKTFFVNTKNALPTGFAYGTASGYHTLQWSQAFTMDTLPDITELTTVFRAYKLNCVIVTIQSLHSSSMFTSGSAPNYYGGNLICYAQKNRSNDALDTAITQDYWDQTPGKITRLITGNKSIRFKVYPKVLSSTLVTPSTGDAQQRRPSWTTTDAAGFSIPHHGLNMQFSLTDPTIPFDNAVVPDSTHAPMNLRVTMKYLFQLRGVH